MSAIDLNKFIKYDHLWYKFMIKSKQLWQFTRKSKNLFHIFFRRRAPTQRH